MDYTPDKLAKTVRIPMKVVDGKLAYFYDTPEPRLKEGAIGEIVLPAYAVLNPDALKLLQSEQKIDLFSAGTMLYLGMKLQQVPQTFHGKLIDPPILSEARGMRLVSVTLKTPLCLILRGTKQAILHGGSCDIPLLKTEATSLNHAYTLASICYETERISHTGNMFTRCFFEQDGAFLPLNILRNRSETDYEFAELLPKK